MRKLGSAPEENWGRIETKVASAPQLTWSGGMADSGYNGLEVVVGPDENPYRQGTRPWVVQFHDGETVHYSEEAPDEASAKLLAQEIADRHAENGEWE